MSKTGKKVKSIEIDRVDLTYNKVYDVFIDSDEYEFIIDDVGHKRYVFVDNKNYYELVDDVAEANNTTDDSHNTNETNSKFKVGDTVRVTSIDYICQYDKNIKVGDVGIITDIYCDNKTPYEVFDWYFPEDDLELVGDDVNTPNKKYNPLVVQQSGNHYKNGEIQPIEYSERNNLSTCQGNIVKYITRHKEKNGVDDLAKIVHYALLEALFVYGEDGATELRDKVDSLINVGSN